MNKGTLPRDFMDKRKHRHDTYRMIFIASCILSVFIVISLFLKGCTALLNWNDRRIDKGIVAEMYQRNGQVLSAETVKRLSRTKPVKFEITGAGEDVR
jgi:hypothetical protein